MVVAAAAAMPASSFAAPSPSDLQVVVTKTAVSKPGLSAVVTLRIKNNGTEAWEATSPGGSGLTTISYQNDDDFTSWVRPRSHYGWSCAQPFAGELCTLNHTVAPGKFSLPIEFEVLPFARQDLDARYVLSASVKSPLQGAGRALEPGDLSIVNPDNPEAPNEINLTWSEDGVADHPRNPAARAEATTATVAGDETTTVGLEVTSATNISTGPIAIGPDSQRGEEPPLLTQRIYQGSCCFVNPQLELSVPSDKFDVLALKAYAPVPEVTIFDQPSTARTDRILDPNRRPDEIELMEEDFTRGENGRITVNLPMETRFLPDNPWRFIATVKLKDGVDEGTLAVDAIAPSVAEPAKDESARTARVAPAFSGPDSAHAEVTVRRAAVVAATPTPTPTPEPSPTPAPTPAPQGAVLGAQASPRLVGKVRFKSHTIRVGRKTTLKVDVTNSGNAASTNGDVCVKLSSHLVILSVPKGVTVKGSVLCAKRSAIGPSQTVTVATGVVVRGVQTTPSATARDGADDGVSVSGDRLRVLQQRQTRGGGVTG